MVSLEIVNGSTLYLNETYIESIEVNSDTVVKIHGGTVYVVKQKPQEILRRISNWQRRCRHLPADTGDLDATAT